MHKMVLGLQSQLHNVANGIGILWNLDVKRILHRPYRGQRMGSGADTANPLGESPGIAGVAALQNHFQPTPHGAAGYRVADDVVLVKVNLTTHMPLNARDRIDDDALAAVV